MNRNIFIVLFLNNRSTRIKKDMAAIVSTVYAPLDRTCDSECASHRRNISDSTTATTESVDSAEPLNPNASSNFTSITPSDFRWTGDPSSKTKEKIFERETQVDEANSASISSSKHLSGGSWLLEIVSLLASALSIAMIIGILFYFDGRALPDWPNGITLNTLIALLTAIANASIAAPLSSGLSQLKWIHFKQERRPLTDMELFDDASRGVYGAMKLLVFAHGG